MVNGPQTASEESCINAPLSGKCPSHFLLPCLLIHAKANVCLLLISFLSNALVYMTTAPAIIHMCSFEGEDSAVCLVGLAVHTCLIDVPFLAFSVYCFSFRLIVVCLLA